jgi:CheY-like chemotaxis protein
LIVDDQADIRLLIRRLIEIADEDVFVSGEAASGREAIERADELAPDVIVLDERMPDLDGLQTARLILERRPGQPIILCTAYVDDGLERRAQAVGIQICLAKSELRDLPAAICRVLEIQQR